jgi:hypothetical protein
MTVVTRSQQRAISSRKQEEEKEDDNYEELKTLFVSKIQKYSDKNILSTNKEDKLRYVLKIYKLVNNLFPLLVEKRPDEYITYSAIIFNKSTDFLIECNEGKWEDINKDLVQELRDEIFKSRCHIMPIIRYCDEYSTNTEIKKAKIYITHRNRRIDL